MSISLEKKFKKVYDQVGKEIEEHLIQAKKLSDKYGIPYDRYIPKSFTKKFMVVGCEPKKEGDIHWDDAAEMNDSLVQYVGAVAPVDTEFWYSSTAECEVWSR